jgi:hypothetical protein
MNEPQEHRMTREIRTGNKFIQRGQPAGTLPRKFLWILLVSLSAMAFALSAALPFFVLNHEKKQCGFVYGGDEYVYNEPPEPWQKANPDKNGMIYTQFGSCNLNEVNFANQQGAETCCQQLGYTFIGEIKGDVVKRDYGLIFGQILSIFGVPIAIILFVVVLVIYSVSNKHKNTGE